MKTVYTYFGWTVTKKQKEIIDLTESLLIGLLIGAFIGWAILMYNANNNEINRKINDVSIQLKSSERITDYTLRGLESQLLEKLAKLDKKIDNLPEVERVKKLLIEAKLKQVNIFLRNETLQATGSGVTIKYKGKFYVLTAGHMAEEDTDKLYLYENDQRICELEIVKHAYSQGELHENSDDLMLLQPTDPDIEPKVYIEIADEEPETTNQLYIVGNPMGMEDVLSDARCILYQGKFMYVIGTSYFGNSGGGVYNQYGELVGIMSHLVPIQPFEDVPAYLIHGAVRLSVILEFLRGVR